MADTQPTDVPSPGPTRLEFRVTWTTIDDVDPTKMGDREMFCSTPREAFTALARLTDASLTQHPTVLSGSMNLTVRFVSDWLTYHQMTEQPGAVMTRHDRLLAELLNR